MATIFLRTPEPGVASGSHHGVRCTCPPAGGPRLARMDRGADRTLRFDRNPTSERTAAN